MTIDPLPLRARTEAELQAELDSRGGESVDRGGMREHMPDSRAVIEEWYGLFGGLAAVTAWERGRVYRWIAPRD